MARPILFLAAVSGLLLVILGAFGAHALEPRLPAGHLVWWHKAVSYQGIHTLAMLGCGLLALQWPSRPLQVAGWLFLAGILLFSGSLYALALSGQRWMGAITPIGGLCFLVGWACLAIAALRH